MGSGATSGEAGRKGSSYVRFARRGRWALGWHGEAGVNAASASSVHGYDTTDTPARRDAPCRAELHRAPNTYRENGGSTR